MSSPPRNGDASPRRWWLSKSLDIIELFAGSVRCPTGCKSLKGRLLRKKGSGATRISSERELPPIGKPTKGKPSRNASIHSSQGRKSRRALAEMPGRHRLEPWRQVNLRKGVLRTALEKEHSEAGQAELRRLPPRERKRPPSALEKRCVPTKPTSSKLGTKRQRPITDGNPPHPGKPEKRRTTVDPANPSQTVQAEGAILPSGPADTSDAI